MENYKNVNVDKLANVYFEGKVVSRNIFLNDGSKKTLGVMLPGEYEFNTESRELMEIISGKLNLKLKDDNDWNYPWINTIVAMGPKKGANKPTTKKLCKINSESGGYFQKKLVAQYPSVRTACNPIGFNHKATKKRPGVIQAVIIDSVLTKLRT